MKPEEIAKSIFARNPEIKELHITADGQAFRDLHAAESHAQRSKYQKIASIKRDGKAKEQTPDADPDKSFADNAQKVAKAAKVKVSTNAEKIVLLGDGSAIDSIAFVNFIVELEELILKETKKNIPIKIDKIHSINTGKKKLTFSDFINALFKIINAKG